MGPGQWYDPPPVPHGTLNLNRVRECVAYPGARAVGSVTVTVGGVPLDPDPDTLTPGMRAMWAELTEGRRPAQPAAPLPNFLVTDARFAREFDWFRREWRARVIWIRRAGCERGAHVSESEDYARFADATIDNDGSFQDLRVALRAAVVRLFPDSRNAHPEPVMEEVD
jgi:hypothetical protein